jgi:protein TonB
MSTNGAFVVSVAVHASLAAALGVLPLLSDEALPAQAESVVDSAPFFVVPLPPPPAGRTDRAQRDPASRVAPRPQAAAAPAPESLTPDEAANVVGAAEDDTLGSPDSDEPGGRGDTVGSVFDGPSAAPPPPPTVVRISSGFTAPQLVRRVEPVYPALAAAARATATVVLEAEVDPQGNVTRVSVTRGHPLFDAAAVEAVKRWRYQPLLLNGVPTAFILTVTVRFGLLR